MRLLAIMLAGAAVSSPLDAAPPGRGPLPEAQRSLIRQLADGHERLRREVTMKEDGYTARTTSADPELATALREHFRYMSARVGSGAMVRRWDPAFVEMIEHHDDIEISHEEIVGGLEVRVRGKTPAAVRVAKNHAKIISGFVKTGDVSSPHPPVLPDGN